jgi:hypothetical protein
MENIILQIVSETAKKYLEYFNGQGVGNLPEMAEDFKLISAEMAKGMLIAFIESTDEAICSAKRERKADGFKIHERNVPRTVFTALGSFTYKRTYFNTPDTREYLLDHILEVNSYERVDAGVSARLVESAALYSYGRSVDIVTGGQVSRQTVRNKIMNTGEVLYVPEKAAYTPEALHIFADEAHVNLQTGKNTIVPLVTICSGKQPISKGRNELISPVHVHGYGIEPETHWEYVYALCAERYDMSIVKAVYIYGDGAARIKKGFDFFPEAMFILDAFHFKKRMRSLLAGEICSNYVSPMYAAIRKGDKKYFDRLVQKMIGAIEEKMPESNEKLKKIKSVKDNAVYILKHWDGIQNAKQPGVIGSCTEAMVSHALAERLSRNPMGWSKGGLSKMAMIRVFTLNGGKIKPADTVAWKHRCNKESVVMKFEKYEEIIKNQNDKILKGAKNWRWFEVENMISGKRTGTSVALDALSRTRNVG